MTKLTSMMIALAAPHFADAHGTLLTPVSRAVHQAHPDATTSEPLAGDCGGAACTWYNQRVTVPETTNCDPKMRTMGVSCDSVDPPDYPCSHATDPGAAPWCYPGKAPVTSPCGIFSGGYQSRGRDMRELPAISGARRETWEAGSAVRVGVSIVANHGGGWAYRLCPSGSDLSEECFQAHHLPFDGDKQWLVDTNGRIVATVPAVRLSNGTFPAGSSWARNPVPMELTDGAKATSAPYPTPPAPFAVGRGPFNFSIVDQLRIPRELPAGEYALSWRWEAEQTKQVWAQCSDVTISAAGAAATPAPLPAAKAGARPVCTGGSLGLDTGDCSSWVAMYDALGGPAWPAEWRQGCADPRLDPCGCSSNAWQISLSCTVRRDLLRLTEIYLLGEPVAGQLPEGAFAALDELVALSFVGTRISGAVPSALGELPSLRMLWLDHNPLLGGPLPASLAKLTSLSALELHHSGFSGALPPLPFKQIADCTLNGLVFDCPLPKGAEACGATCK